VPAGQNKVEMSSLHNSPQTDRGTAGGPASLITLGESDDAKEAATQRSVCPEPACNVLVAVREGAILAGPQGPLWHWLSERKHHQAGRLARQRLDLRVVPLQGKVQKRIVRAATRGLPKWPHFSLPPTCNEGVPTQGEFGPAMELQI
jgi:hypothetical protein